MKFEFDSRTGHMMPKKNEQIYFARSMSGGLRIDDHLNNIKYIIERNGDIKPIQGVLKGLNIYDNRNAHIISDRVKRMFGSSHPYANYKLFLKGYNGIKSYDDFVGEGFMTRSLDRKKSNDARKEDGILVRLPNGDKVILGDVNCGLPYQLDGDEYYVILEDFDDLVIFGYNDGDIYTYFTYQILDDEVELNEIASSNYDMTEDDFVLIKAMYDNNITDSDDNMGFDNFNTFYECTVNENSSYYLFDNEDNVRTTAFDRMSEWVEDVFNSIDSVNDIEDRKRLRKQIENWVDNYGDSIMNEGEIENFMREDYESYVNNIEDENGDHGNRLFDEMMEANIIDDNDDYFEFDEDGELDYDQPTFDIDEKKEELVEHIINQYDSPVQWYLDNFDGKGISNYIDTDKLVDCIIDDNGLTSCIGASEDYEYEKDGYRILIYRI